MLRLGTLMQDCGQVQHHTLPKFQSVTLSCNAVVVTRGCMGGYPKVVSARGCAMREKIDSGIWHDLNAVFARRRSRLLNAANLQGGVTTWTFATSRETRQGGMRLIDAHRVRLRF